MHTKHLFNRTLFKNTVNHSSNYTTKNKQNTPPKTYINMIAHTYTNAMRQLTQLSAPAA